MARKASTGQPKPPAAARSQARRSTRAREPETGATAQQTRTLKSKAAFLKLFAVNGNVLLSAREAGVGRRTIYDWLAEDERFKELYDEAREDAVDTLEEEARRRAVEGTRKPVFHQGKPVGFVREYSDTLLILLLKGKRPDVYRERFEHSGPKGGPIETKSVVSLYIPDNGRKPTT